MEYEIKVVSENCFVVREKDSNDIVAECNSLEKAELICNLVNKYYAAGRKSWSN